MAKSSFGAPIDEPERVERVRVAQGMRRVGGVDQRLRGNAADVEASSSDPVRFDEDRVEAELAGADRRDITAGAAADDEHLAAKLVHVTSSMNSVAGVSISARTRWMKVAASYPSTTR